MVKETLPKHNQTNAKAKQLVNCTTLQDFVVFNIVINNLSNLLNYKTKTLRFNYENGHSLIRKVVG